MRKARPRRDFPCPSGSGVGDTGLEQPAKSPGNTGFLETTGTQTGTVQDEASVKCPGLQMVVNVWAHLSQEDRKRILAVVRETAESVSHTA